MSNAMFERLLVSLILISGVIAANETYYDTFTGNPITLEEYKKHIDDNTTFWCTGSYLPCDAQEGRRLDGSCNNLWYPTKGPARTPYVSLLPFVFEKDNSPKKPKSGIELDYRKLRDLLLTEGSIPDETFSVILVHYLLFAFGNVGSLHDTVNYVVWKPNCCSESGKNDSECFPMKISPDDKVHQFSGIRCFNNTKPKTYQSEGCIRDKTTTPARLNSANSFLDLSNMYGPDASHRSFKDGLLNVEIENNIIWPESLKGPTLCYLNEPPAETRCHSSIPLNGLFGINFVGILLWRHHNFIAQGLKKLNPCWNDEKLFTVARDINIAIYVQIYYYELLPLLLGKSFMQYEGLIGDGGFRDLYDERVTPQQYLEHTYALRWVHTIQPGHYNMYDDQGHYLRNIAVSNLTLHTGYLPVGDHMESLTHGSYLQGAGKIDHTVDSILTQNGLEKLQRAFDILAADLMKGGLHGLQSYTAYREMCTGKSYKTFESLTYDMDPENLEILKSAFDDVDDIPLMAGLWLEKFIPGGYAPKTFACILSKQLKRFMQSDRHWYERENRPNAFTKEQLGAIRQAKMAQVYCNVGDNIKSIQPNVFLRVGPMNRITSCDRIPRVNLAAWKDPRCRSAATPSANNS